VSLYLEPHFVCAYPFGNERAAVIADEPTLIGDRLFAQSNRGTNSRLGGHPPNGVGRESSAALFFGRALEGLAPANAIGSIIAYSQAL
jgi:hypothetical protein